MKETRTLRIPPLSIFNKYWPKHLIKEDIDGSITYTICGFGDTVWDTFADEGLQKIAPNRILHLNSRDSFRELPYWNVYPELIDFCERHSYLHLINRNLKRIKKC